ncbi:MAG: non-canonical purine NTP pyrophosphatase [Mycoplasmataceae bacterium]|jgi:XTP/dITP diphosphohydrolase|nr:non-canonical purine NTP pyrophosphatase [Mycoplasmataceae bacterium]
MKIVIATNNQQKFQQILYALKPLNKYCVFLSLKDINYHKKINENGKTFAQNSLKKALQVFRDIGYVTIAEDSGLCINALNGEPGVFTSRFAGVNATRRQQLIKILHKMKKVSIHDRKAYFVSVVTCVFSTKKIIQTQGKLLGSISEKIININNGLIHDPIFIPKGYKITLSKLSINEKLKINHRGQAIRKLISKIKKCVVNLH